MTRREFDERIALLFRRSPIVPAVIVLKDGRRVVADSPRLLKHFPPGMVSVTHPNESPGITVVGVEMIDRVIPIDELPAESGVLSYTDFYASVRPHFWADPFRPYVLDLRSGESLEVGSPAQLTLAGRFGTYVSDTPPRIVRFTFDQVTRVRAADPINAAG